ncbi:leucine-rich repeat domain-containing protein [Terrisporobacter hibernicus]|uniref:Leucine-rich repeat domain-containing protein n=1 Tax=Terrisporobacter hibernicus TaxID=2813371 RepID=A0AAX2ZJ16_9FIRM|nr:leucine-rich repeat domain-containing protein [Terrisporobacter hibernicus]UEL49187.1 leucine-rich repeat domain-containing protein [Terrisporobacter hibernicus]
MGFFSTLFGSQEKYIEDFLGVVYTRISREFNIPSGVTIISNNDFTGFPSSKSGKLRLYADHNEDDNLERIFISDTVKKIEDNPFCSCYKLKKIEIDDDNKHFMVNNDVLFTKPLSKLISYPKNKECSNYSVPKGVNAIGDGAFSQCIKLRNIDLPNSLVSIEKYAFFGCININKINIPNYVTHIGEYTFYKCDNLENINLSNRLEVIQDYAFKECKKLTNIIIPKGIKQLGKYTFSENKNLLYVKISEGLRDLEEGVFYRCYKLKDVLLPDTLMSIGSYTFYQCKNIEKIVLPKDLTKIGDRAFEECYKLKDINIPKSLNEIGRNAFRNCKSLTSISISNSIKVIYSRTFEGCVNLANIVIPNSVTEIYSYAFKDCKRFTSITIPSSVTEIHSYAFEGCVNLTEIIIPKSVISIKDHTFDECENLTIYGYKDSCAQEFARKDQIPFEVIKEELNQNKFKFDNSNEDLEMLGYNLYNSIESGNNVLKNSVENNLDKNMYIVFTNYTDLYPRFLERYNLKTRCINDNSKATAVFLLILGHVFADSNKAISECVYSKLIEFAEYNIGFGDLVKCTHYTQELIGMSDSFYNALLDYIASALRIERQEEKKDKSMSSTIMDIVGYNEESRIKIIAQQWIGVFYGDKVMSDFQMNSFIIACNDANVNSKDVVNKINEMFENGYY